MLDAWCSESRDSAEIRWGWRGQMYNRVGAASFLSLFANSKRDDKLTFKLCWNKQYELRGNGRDWGMWSTEQLKPWTGSELRIRDGWAFDQATAGSLKHPQGATEEGIKETYNLIIKLATYTETSAERSFGLSRGLTPWRNAFRSDTRLKLPSYFLVCHVGEHLFAVNLVKCLNKNQFLNGADGMWELERCIF